MVYVDQEWWTYVCMGPSDPHPNWHLGMRGTQHRAVMWRVWKEGGTGFLYWGANCYEKATVASAEVPHISPIYTFFWRWQFKIKELFFFSFSNSVNGIKLESHVKL